MVRMERARPAGRMGDLRVLFTVLRDQIEVNARHAVEAYAHEVAEYRSVSIRDGDDPTDILGFAVFIRRRSIVLAEADVPLDSDDLSTIATVGRQRAERGLSVWSQQRVLGLHTAMMLREIHDAAGPADVLDMLRMVGWFGTQGVRARDAYLQGYIDGLSRSSAVVSRSELLARVLLADGPVDPTTTAGEVPISPVYLVSVLRVPAPPPEPKVRTAAAYLIAARGLPVAWLAPEELVLLTPGSGDAARATGLGHVRDAVAAIGRPCQVGAADGRTGRLAESLTRARETSRVAPWEDRPARLYGVADLFVELSLAQAPQIDAWLRAFGGRLSAGPDLVSTLYAYYRYDMNRAATAAALRIHPRTLDYRLQRVRAVAGVDPGSTRGVRMLSAAVARILADEPGRLA
jgi:PucR C-terminal helix-turn-helix domain